MKDYENAVFINHAVRNGDGVSKFCHHCGTPAVTMARLNHPNIVRIFVFQDKGAIQIANPNSSGTLYACRRSRSQRPAGGA
jgi:hypothetical protein